MVFHVLQVISPMFSEKKTFKFLGGNRGVGTGQWREVKIMEKGLRELGGLGSRIVFQPFRFLNGKKMGGNNGQGTMGGSGPRIVFVHILLMLLETL